MNNLNDKSYNADLTIVVNTCDSYSDVLSLFFAAFFEHWPNCGFDVVINTEKNSYVNYPANIHNYKPGKFNSWGDRLLQTLESINTEFVLVLYDDFILEKDIDETEIKAIIDFMKLNSSAAVFYLVNTSLPYNMLGDTTEKFVELLDYSDFKLNSFPAVWRRTDLMKYTGRNDNPWAWEVFGSYRTYNDGKKFYSLTSASDDIYHYDYSRGGAIYRGKWVKSVVLSKFTKYKLNIDTSLRGFSDDSYSQPRSLFWKVKFLLIGFKMVGFKSLKFIPRYIKAKYNALKK
ncbi:hypothetical protein [Shewanella xiamenensis]|uniref:hypothetical protein n=1 Tax=Shewanella xiamenensis TaxID=332186 RepID=UPI0021BF88AF|nr:hypothetical protein [Shewanella xiamenensis]MCT8876896.1 hypothetical protein [Shewanella xiamenensis]